MSSKTYARVADAPHYRYRLNENCGLGEQVNFKGKTLFRSKWFITQYKERDFQSTLRSDKNPKGMIDEENYIPTSGKIIKTTVPQKAPDIIYHASELLVMDRGPLTDICVAYGIEFTNMKTEALIKAIVEDQKARPDYEEKKPMIVRSDDKIDDKTDPSSVNESDVISEHGRGCTNVVSEGSTETDVKPKAKLVEGVKP